jgi:hypothetical protein
MLLASLHTYLVNLFEAFLLGGGALLLLKPICDLFLRYKFIPINFDGIELIGIGRFLYVILICVMHCSFDVILKII